MTKGEQKLAEHKARMTKEYEAFAKKHGLSSEFSKAHQNVFRIIWIKAAMTECLYHLKNKKA